MNINEFDDIRELLLMFEVPVPRAELVLETKRLMHEELKELSVAPSLQAGWIVMLVGMAFVMTLGLFYTFTVGAILSVTLPPYLAEFLDYTLYVFTAAGGILIAGMLMIFYFKQFKTMQYTVA